MFANQTAAQTYKNNACFRVLQILLIVASAHVGSRSAVAAEIRFSKHENPNAVFAGTKLVRKITLDQRPASGSRILWNLKVGPRSVRSGEVGAAEAGSNLMRFEVQLPPVRPGVVLDAELSVTLIKPDDTRKTVRQPLSLFPADISTDVAAWNERTLAVFDPAKSTADKMRAQGFGFQAIDSLAALRRTTAKVLVVGENTSVREWRDLPTDLVSLAQRGICVLWLSPEGQFDLSTIADAESLVAYHFSTLDRQLMKIDKRFSTLHWPVIRDQNAITLGAANRRVALNFQQQSGWHWFEAEFSNRSRIAFCSVPIVGQWNSNPVPRHLLARLLNKLRTSEKMTEEK